MVKSDKIQAGSEERAEEKSNATTTLPEEPEKEQGEEKLHYSAPVKIGTAGSPDAPPFNNGPGSRRTIDFFQKSYGNAATLRHYNYPIQAKLQVSQPNDPYEQEAERAEENVIENGHPGIPTLSSARPIVQRSPAEGETTTAIYPPAPEKTQPAAAMAPPEETKTPTPGLLVDDSAKELIPGQMHKSEFLGQLREAVCTTAEAALSGTIWSVMGCPWIDHWFGYYGGRDAQSIERAIQRYAPGASGVSAAADYIPIICGRVRSAIEQWSATGEVNGVPEGVPAGFPGMPTPSADGSPTSASGLISFKAREGCASGAADPQAVQAQLNSGSSLDSGVRTQMESAFGQDFSGVRVHTDSKAKNISDGLNARAFTIGKDVAFASGEYQPGTIIGDALIAHELAHVVQQGGSAGFSSMQNREAADTYSEQDADISALGAMNYLFSGFLGIAAGWKRMLPRARSGLTISRCSKSQKPAPGGIHYDEAISCAGTPKEGLQTAFPDISVDESADQEEILSNLATMNAGGVYVFFGHGASETMGGSTVGINPASGHTIRGEAIERQLSSDSNPPTVVVLGACGSATLLNNVTSGGVPVAVGFNQSVSNAVAATAIDIFMTDLNDGKTFGQAQNKANEFLVTSPFDFMPELIISYGEGYTAGMTLQEARDRHTGK